MAEMMRRGVGMNTPVGGKELKANLLTTFGELLSEIEVVFSDDYQATVTKLLNRSYKNHYAYPNFSARLGVQVDGEGSARFYINAQSRGVAFQEVSDHVDFGPFNDEDETVRDAEALVGGKGLVEKAAPPAVPGALNRPKDGPPPLLLDMQGRPMSRARQNYLEHVIDMSQGTAQHDRLHAKAQTQGAASFVDSSGIGDIPVGEENFPQLQQDLQNS